MTTTLTQQSPLNGIKWANEIEIGRNHSDLTYSRNTTISNAVQAITPILKDVFKSDRANVYCLNYNSYGRNPDVLINCIRLDESWGGDRKEMSDYVAPKIISAKLDYFVSKNRGVYYSSSRQDDYTHEFKLILMVDIQGVVIPIITDVAIAKKFWNIVVGPTTIVVEGHVFEWNSETILTKEKELSLYGIYQLRKILPLSYDELQTILRYSNEKYPNLDRKIPSTKPSGITKVYAKLEPLLEDFKNRYPVEYSAFVSAVADSRRTITSVKCSSVFNAELADITTIEQLKDKFCDFCQKENRYVSRYGNGLNEEGSDDWYLSQPSFIEFRKTSLKRNNTRAFGKLMQDFEFLNLDPEKFPFTYEAILADEIPVSTFFRKSEQYFLLNDNFDLWEEMLAKHHDTACALAKAVSTRTTYEKDLMSYFFFVLYTLPEYLEKHTGEKWTCSPKLVDSTTELDPPKEDDDSGITRKRSALTPIVDNEAKTVTVPYASLAMPGRQTTYCYSHDYHVLARGFSFNGNTVAQDLEEKLNGRDDYGLMFYTFTGSPQGRGYPTFLIIFERRQSGTHVHFHRTHPSRSKDGDYNPIHNWIKVCYNWMIGNVPRGNIAAQQGDLAFVSISPDKKEFNDKVSYYDNHEFEAPVLFNDDVPAKQNILGYVQLTQPTMLNHHEHEAVLIPSGTYEIRQCRSWEANPKGIWSLRID